MTCQYFLVRDDIYYRFNEGAKKVGVLGDVFGVMFDSENGALISWGEEKIVRARFEHTVNGLKATMPEYAEDLMLVTFLTSGETIEELNACIATSGRILQFPSFLMRHMAN